MASVLAAVPDLMLASRVEGMLTAAGHEVEVSPQLPAEMGGYDVVVCDLEAVDYSSISAAGPGSIGFYSHVNVEARSGALAAGVDIVIPRSRMARELPKLVERLLAG